MDKSTETQENIILTSLQEDNIINQISTIVDRSDLLKDNAYKALFF